ncbi:MAG: hypothetical protein U1F07_02000 [Rubrivivax sp.]
MLRPLYLDRGVPWQVRLDAGVALSVAAEGRARSLYPLRRLSRVVCGRNARWRTDALVACLEAGVPIVFHGAHDETVGWCFGARRRETTLAQLLREGLAEPDWPERFETWRAALQRREMRAALAQLRVCAAHHAPAHVRALLCNRHRLRLGVPVGPWLRALTQAAAGLAAEAAQRMVGDPALLAFARPGLHLPQILAGLLEWRCHRLLHGASLASLRAAAPGKAAATLLDCGPALVQRGCGEFLGALELDLREWLL